MTEEVPVLRVIFFIPKAGWFLAWFIPSMLSIKAVKVCYKGERVGIRERQLKASICELCVCEWMSQQLRAGEVSSWVSPSYFPKWKCTQVISFHGRFASDCNVINCDCTTLCFIIKWMKLNCLVLTICDLWNKIHNILWVTYNICIFWIIYNIVYVYIQSNTWYLLLWSL